MIEHDFVLDYLQSHDQKLSLREAVFGGHRNLPHRISTRPHSSVIANYEMVKWCEEVAGEEFRFNATTDEFQFSDLNTMMLFKLTWI